MNQEQIGATSVESERPKSALDLEVLGVIHGREAHGARVTLPGHVDLPRARGVDPFLRDGLHNRGNW